MNNVITLAVACLLTAQAAQADLISIDQVREQARSGMPLEFSFVQVEKALAEFGYERVDELLTAVPGSGSLDATWIGLVRWRRRSDGVGTDLRLVIKQRTAAVSPFLTRVEILPQMN